MTHTELIPHPTDAEVNARLRMNLPAWWDCGDGGLDCYGGDNRKVNYGWAGSNKTHPDLFMSEVALVERLCHIRLLAELSNRLDDGTKIIKANLKAHPWAKRAHLVYTYLEPLATFAAEAAKLQWVGSCSVLAGYTGDLSNSTALKGILSVATDTLSASLWAYTHLWSHAVEADMGEWDSLPSTSPMLRVPFSAWLHAQYNSTANNLPEYYSGGPLTSWKELRLGTAQGAHHTAYLHMLARWCEKAQDTLAMLNTVSTVDILPEIGKFILNLTDEQFNELRRSIPYQGRMSILRRRTNAQWPETINHLRQNPRTRQAVDEWLQLHKVTSNG